MSDIFDQILQRRNQKSGKSSGAPDWKSVREELQSPVQEHLPQDAQKTPQESGQQKLEQERLNPETANQNIPTLPDEAPSFEAPEVVEMRRKLEGFDPSKFREQMSPNIKQENIPAFVNTDRSKELDREKELESVQLDPEIQGELDRIKKKHFSEPSTLDHVENFLLNVVSGGNAAFGDMVAGLSMIDKMNPVQQRLYGSYFTDMADKYAGKLRGEAQSMSNRAIGTGVEQTFLSSELPQGLGSIAPFVLGSIASGGSAAVGTGSAAALGAAINIGSLEQEKGFNELSQAEKATVVMIRGGIGASEAFGMGKILAKFGTPVKGGVHKKIASILTDGGEEAFQETFTSTLNNLTARELYDAQREIISAETGREALAGFILGGGMSTISQIASKRLKEEKNLSGDEKRLYQRIQTESNEAIKEAKAEQSSSPIEGESKEVVPPARDVEPSSKQDGKAVEKEGASETSEEANPPVSLEEEIVAEEEKAEEPKEYPQVEEAEEKAVVAKDTKFGEEEVSGDVVTNRHYGRWTYSKREGGKATEAYKLERDGRVRKFEALEDGAVAELDDQGNVIKEYGKSSKLARGFRMNNTSPLAEAGLKVEKGKLIFPENMDEEAKSKIRAYQETIDPEKVQEVSDSEIELFDQIEERLSQEESPISEEAEVEPQVEEEVASPEEGTSTKVGISDTSIREAKRGPQGLKQGEVDILINAISEGKRNPKADAIANSSMGKSLLSKSNALLEAYRKTGRDGKKDAEERARGDIARKVHSDTTRKTAKQVEEVVKANDNKIYGPKGMLNAFRKKVYKGSVAPDKVVATFEEGMPSEVRKVYDERTEAIASVTTEEEAKAMGFKSVEDFAKAAASQIIFDKKGRKKGEFTNRNKGNRVEHVAIQKYNEASEVSTQIDGPVSDESYAAQQRKRNTISPDAYVPGADPIPISPIRSTAHRKTARKSLKDLSKGLNVPILYSSPRKSKNFGSYNRRSGVLKIKTTNDVPTAAHEFGHAIDSKHKLLDNPAAIDPDVSSELLELSKWGSPVPAGSPDPLLYRLREGFAEFLYGMVINPDETRRLYPETAAMYDSRVDKGMRDAIAEFSDDIRMWAGAPQIESNKANIMSVLPETEHKTFGEFMDKIGNIGQKINGVLYDAMAPVWDLYNNAVKQQGKNPHDIRSNSPAENVKMMARNLNGFGDQYDLLITEGLTNEHNEHVKHDGENMNERWLFEKLDKSTGKNMAKEMDDVSSIMISQRTVQLADQKGRDDHLSGTGLGIYSDLDKAKATLAEFEQMKETDPDRYEAYSITMERYRAWSEQLLDHMLEGGRITAEEYKAVKQSAEKDGINYYVAMQRVVEATPMGHDAAKVGESVSPFNLTDPYKPLRKLKGSKKVIKNPFDTLMIATYSTYKEVARNRINQALVSAVEGVDLRNNNSPEAMQVRNSMVDVTKEVKGKLSSDQQLKDKIVVYMPHGHPEAAPGEMRIYQVDPDVARAMKYMYSSRLNRYAAVRVARAVKTLIQTTITHNPVFATINATRDFGERMTSSTTLSDHPLNAAEATYRGITTTAQAAAAIAGKGDPTLISRWKRFGGSQAGYYVRDPLTYGFGARQSITRLAKKKNHIVVNPFKLGFYSEANKFDLRRHKRAFDSLWASSENLNRLAEFKSAYDEGIRKGLSEYEANVYAAYKARELMDFAVAGTLVKEMGNFIPFLNPAFRGTARKFEIIKRNPGMYMARYTAMIAIPTIIARSFMSDDEEEAYEELPPYQKDMFVNIPYRLSPYTMKKLGIPYTKKQGMWMSIPMSHENALMHGAAMRTVSWMNGAENAWDGYAGTALSTLVPYSLSNAFGIFQPLVEMSANKRFFTDSRIVFPLEEKKKLGLRTGRKFASPLSQYLSDKLMDAKIEADPRYIDHFVKGYFNRYGKFVLDVSEAFREGDVDTHPYRFIHMAPWIRKTPVYQAKSVREVIELAEENGIANTKEFRDFKAMLGSYYNAPAEKQPEMGEVVIQYAKDLVKVYREIDRVNDLKIEQKRQELKDFKKKYD